MSDISVSGEPEELQAENDKLREELKAIKAAQRGSDKKVGELQQQLADLQAGNSAAGKSLSLREDELAEREQLITKREAALDRIEALKSVGMPEELQGLIKGDDPAELAENARRLKDILNDEVQSGVSAEIARSSPLPRSGDDSTRKRLSDYSREDAEHMSDRAWSELIKGGG